MWNIIYKKYSNLFVFILYIVTFNRKKFQTVYKYIRKYVCCFNCDNTIIRLCTYIYLFIGQKNRITE